MDFWIYGPLTINPRLGDFGVGVLKSLTLRVKGFEIGNPKGLGSGTFKNHEKKSI
mgnify:CR=1 FL=1